MFDVQKNRKLSYPGQRIKYVIYTLCRNCHSVNVPAPQVLCSKCNSSVRPHDNYRPSKTANYRTKKAAAKCGGLPWQYRQTKSDKALCFLKYEDYEISVWRSSDKSFCFYAGNQNKNVIRKHIPELVFARTRAVRALARIMNISFDELVEKIKTANTNKKGEK